MRAGLFAWLAVACGADEPTDSGEDPAKTPPQGDCAVALPEVCTACDLTVRWAALPDAAAVEFLEVLRIEGWGVDTRDQVCTGELSSSDLANVGELAVTGVEGVVPADQLPDLGDAAVISARGGDGELYGTAVAVPTEGSSVSEIDLDYAPSSAR